MASSKTVADDDPVSLFGTEAVDLVKRGYDRLKGELDAAQKGSVVPKGHLWEVLRKWVWAPPLLNAEEYEKFCALTGRYIAENALQALWNILENACDERRLLPAITIERDHGQAIVVLR